MKTILLVIGKIGTRLVCEELLKSHDVIATSDANEAIKRLDDFDLKRRGVDLIIAGYEAGSMTGVDFVERVRARKGKMFLPVLALSRADYKEAFKKAGANSWLKAPFSKEAFQTVVGKYVG